MHVEASYVRAPHRQVFLDLCGDAGLAEAAAARGTGGRQRHVDRFVDRRGRHPMRVAAMLAPGPTTAQPRRRRRRAFRKRRGWPFPRAAGRVQRLGQSPNLTPQSIALALSSEIANRRLGIVVGALAHAPLTPESSRRYKPDPLTSYVLFKPAAFAACRRSRFSGLTGAESAGSPNQRRQELGSLDVEHSREGVAQVRPELFEDVPCHVGADLTGELECGVWNVPIVRIIGVGNTHRRQVPDNLREIEPRRSRI
jgi:hypothetical protein